MSTSITMDILARDHASTTMTKVGRSAEHSAGLVHKLGGALGAVLTGGALALGGGELVHVFSELAEGAAEDEESARRMALQFHNSAGATDAQVDATERWITAQGKALGVADDQLRPALTRLVTATHDVGEAQKETSLAMDIAAGTGKSLDTVTAALVKGYNGSVGGLSRLGVATKDAAGNTLTFDQIQQNLARTFSGQAADAADTAAGRYQRLKVELSEMGESIGYKLLPVATDFGQWLLDDGIPAASRFGGYLSDELGPSVQQLSGWFKENRAELQSVGEEILGTAVPAVEHLANGAGKLLGLFDDLPGPVKQFGIEAGIAAVAVPKLTSAISGMSLPQFARNVANAETRTRALGDAARAAAGGAGMALLIDSAQRTDTSLGRLEQVVGATAAGFSTGSLLVTGLAATAASLNLVRQDADDVNAVLAQAQDVLRAGAADSYAASLKKVNDQLDQARGFGFDDMFGGTTSVGTIVGWIRDGNDLIETQQELRSALSESGSVADLFGQSIGLTAEQLRDGSTAAHQMDDSLSDLSGWFSKREAVRSYGDAVKRLAQGLRDGFTRADVDQLDATGQSILRVAAAIKDPGRRDTFITNSIANLDKVATNASPKAQAAIEQLVTKLHDKALTDPAPTKLTADDRGLQNRIAADTADLGIMGRLAAKPTIAGDDSPFRAMYGSVQAALAQADRARAVPKVSADTSAAETGIRAVDILLNGLHDKTVTVHYNYTGLRSPSRGGGGGDITTQRSAAGAVDDLGKVLDAHHVDLTREGQRLIESVAQGIQKGSLSLDRVLSKVESAIDKRTKAYKRALTAYQTYFPKVDPYQQLLDNYNKIQAEYDSLAGGFSGFQSSVFAVQGSTDPTTGAQLPATLAQILGQGQANQDSSGQLNSDVQALLGKGLDKAYLLQLEQAGLAGEQNIHTLAMQASLQDIATLNAQQVATDQNLSAAGTAIAERLDRQSLNDAQAAVTQLQANLAGQAAQAKQQVEVVKRLDQLVDGFSDLAKSIGDVKLTLTADQLEATLVKGKKNKGK